MKAEVYCRQILEQAIRGSVPRRHGTAAVADADQTAARALSCRGVVATAVPLFVGIRCGAGRAGRRYFANRLCRQSAVRKIESGVFTRPTRTARAGRTSRTVGNGRWNLTCIAPIRREGAAYFDDLIDHLHQIHGLRHSHDSVGHRLAFRVSTGAIPRRREQTKSPSRHLLAGSHGSFLLKELTAMSCE